MIRRTNLSLFAILILIPVMALVGTMPIESDSVSAAALVANPITTNCNVIALLHKEAAREVGSEVRADNRHDVNVYYLNSCGNLAATTDHATAVTSDDIGTNALSMNLHEATPISNTGGVGPMNVERPSWAAIDEYNGPSAVSADLMNTYYGVSGNSGATPATFTNFAAIDNHDAGRLPGDPLKYLRGECAPI
jgi:hypothetical protein